METQRHKDHNKTPNIDADEAWNEYQSLPDNEWRKDHYYQETGGFVATHVLKAKDTMKRRGIAMEVKTCQLLAVTGKRILRLPENVYDKIDFIVIDGKKYRDLLKFKRDVLKPRGYPDVYFDGQTWDFKTSTFENEDSLRQTIKEGRKADNIIFLVESLTHIGKLEKVIHREIGMRKQDGSWVELPNVYCYFKGELINVWHK